MDKNTPDSRPNPAIHLHGDRGEHDGGEHAVRQSRTVVQLDWGAQRPTAKTYVIPFAMIRAGIDGLCSASD